MSRYARRLWVMAIAFCAVDLASSCISLHYVDWGDQAVSRPARSLGIGAGHVCYVAAPAWYFNSVEWSSDPPPSGWSIRTSRYGRVFWIWKFVLRPDACLMRIPL